MVGWLSWFKAPVSKTDVLERAPRVQISPPPLNKNYMTEEKKEQNLYNASEMKKVIQTAEMALWLDGYDDIFSDFDPRPFGVRSISDDFLLEMKKVARGRGHDSCELKFLLAPEVRNYKHEEEIKERLKHFFSGHHREMLLEKKKELKRGIIFVFFGVLVMVFASLVRTYLQLGSFYYNFIIVLAEPAGWFLFWEGLARAMYRAEEIGPEVEFYSKMAHSKISFISY